ncbi:MAG: DUF2062 domain-containing protein [Alcanivoracaceae bacterium]|nr:DUF2062 domain-containing protein [Alcanivoracaceae bacterium]
MPKRLFRKYLPTPERIRENKSLSFLGAVLGDPNLWHVNRHSLAGAAFIGVFTAFLPIPAQMMVAAILAVRFKCNMPLSLLLVWITNPLTIAPVFYFTYRIGAWIMGMPPHVPEHVSFVWLVEQLGPLWLGSVLSGLLLGVIAWGSVKLVWRFSVVRKWQKRRDERRLREA